MDSKFILKSKTIWGAIIGFLPPLMSLVGVAPDPVAIGALSAAGTGVIDLGWGLVNAANEVVGGALVIWGRLTAKTALKVKT